MANPPHEPQSGGLSLRLRALRREHPTLAVLTEIIQFDEQRVTFRATVRIDGETRAQGHAAQAADRAGTFVAAAERLAVEQALLLGGFGSVEVESTAQTNRNASPPPELTLASPNSTREPIAPADNPTPATPRRQRRADRSAHASIPAQIAGETERPEPAPVSDPPEPPSIASTATDTTVDKVGATASQAEPQPAPARKRDRRAERERARARRSDDTPEADQAAPAGAVVPKAEAEPPIPEEPQVPVEDAASTADTSPAPEIAPDAPAPPPTRPRRRASSRTNAAPETPPAPEAQGTHESVRAAWQIGRPIPAWWPPDRIAVEKPLSKAQVERLRARAIDEEITASQLDSYSMLLFGSNVAGLNQAQGVILEERLNPAYPSPLQELSARRLLHRLAVGDTVTIPDDQPAFIRWSEVPPVEEPAEPSQPAVPSWRMKRVPKRRRR